MYKYESKVGVGGKYVDGQTKIEGVVVALEFHQHSCERAVLECVEGTEIKNYVFDAARLEEISPPPRREPAAPPEQHDAPRTGGAFSTRVRSTGRSTR